MEISIPGLRSRESSLLSDDQEVLINASVQRMLPFRAENEPGFGCEFSESSDARASSWLARIALETRVLAPPTSRDVVRFLALPVVVDESAPMEICIPLDGVPFVKEGADVAVKEIAAAFVIPDDAPPPFVHSPEEFVVKERVEPAT